jgi:hypothetical protein
VQCTHLHPLGYGPTLRAPVSSFLAVKANAGSRIPNQRFDLSTGKVNHFLTKVGENCSGAKQETNGRDSRQRRDVYLFSFLKYLNVKAEHNWECTVAPYAQSVIKRSILTHSAGVCTGHVQNSAPEGTLCFQTMCQLTNSTQELKILCTQFSAVDQLTTETDFSLHASFFPPSLHPFVLCFMYEFIPPLHTHTHTHTHKHTHTFSLCSFPFLFVYLLAFSLLLNFPHRSNCVFTSSLTGVIPSLFCSFLPHILVFRLPVS